MNILPLIIAFLTILALCSYSFLQERVSSHLEAKGYRGYMRAERLVRNRMQSAYYQKKRIKGERERAALQKRVSS